MRGLLAGVIAGALVGTVMVNRPLAQPAGDVDRAKELYTSARKALDEKRFEDAVRDFGAAFEITKDPALFYWIGSANEQAGKCDTALVYYRRYLAEAKPSEQFQTTVKGRITACGGDAKPVEPVGSGSAPEPVGSGSAPEPVGGVAIGSGSAPAAPIRARHQGPWIMIGGAVALVTMGAVLAYSADAAENDVSDLYVGLEGTPPVFDARTKRRYDDLIAEGERYEKLSWASFALAGGLAIGAGVWFYVSRDKREAIITPTVQKDGAGVAARIRW